MVIECIELIEEKGRDVLEIGMFQDESFSLKNLNRHDLLLRLSESNSSADEVFNAHHFILFAVEPQSLFDWLA